MFTKHRVLPAAALLIAALGISPLAAQISNFESNTGKATNGLFSTETDNFLDVNNWEEVEFSKFFTTLQADEADGIGAGLAVTAGSAYLGFGYFGKFWEGSINSSKTEYGNNYATQDWRKKQTIDKSATLAWTNQVSFLLGTAAVGGIRLDLSLSGMGKNNNEKDSLDSAGGKTTNKSAVGLGALEAGIGWGKNFDMGGGYILKPNLGFAYCFDMNKTVSKPGGGSVETTTLGGADPYFSQADGYTGILDGEVGLTGMINAGAGLGIDRAADGWDGSLWVDYGFETHLYDKQLTDTFGYWEDYAPSFTGHLINIGVGAWYALDRRLSLGWSVEGDFGLISAKVTSVQDTGGLPPDHEYSDLVFGISPKIAAGVVYKAVPDRLNFNASLALYPLEYSFRKFSHVDMAYTQETRTDKSHIIGSAYTTTSLGLTWFIANGLAFDTAISAAMGARVDITALSALLSLRY